MAGEDFLEGANGVLQWHKFALITGEDLGDLEGLRHETLDFTGTFNSKLVLLRQLVHTQDSNNILLMLLELIGWNIK
jgi:hypothetical protein